MKKTYSKPSGPMIHRTSATEKLYSLEDKAHSSFKQAAEELGRVLGHTQQQFWTDTLPEALLAFLAGWDRKAVKAACETWLENYWEPCPSIRYQNKSVELAKPKPPPPLLRVGEVLVGFTANGLMRQVKGARKWIGKVLTRQSNPW